nr:energy transducer TonB [Hymenobacter telluris]
MPAYKNGELTQFIAKNAKWPTSSKPINAEGKVFIGFIVDKTGGVRDAKVLKGIHPALDAEALRVVQLLDKQFTPGQQNNLPVDVRYVVPVTFKRE